MPNMTQLMEIPGVTLTPPSTIVFGWGTPGAFATKAEAVGAFQDFLETVGVPPLWTRQGCRIFVGRSGGPLGALLLWPGLRVAQPTSVVPICRAGAVSMGTHRHHFISFRHARDATLAQLAWGSVSSPSLSHTPDELETHTTNPTSDAAVKYS